jgi:hypothetical protein
MPVVFVGNTSVGINDRSLILTLNRSIKLYLGYLNNFFGLIFDTHYVLIITLFYGLSETKIADQSFRFGYEDA